MSVTVKVNGTANSLVHKGSSGRAKNTVPDVCKTPSPGGPIPVPYPVILSMSSDLSGGTVTVNADGGNSCAIKGSNFSRCSGDEAGTAGGVKSSTNMKESAWILYSFDVKLEGQNACRKSDKMMMNHENTLCMTGEDQAEVSGSEGEDPKCAKIAAEIDRLINTVRPPTPPGGFPQGYQGLAQRWREVAENVGSKGADGKFIRNHLNEYAKGQEKLKEQLKKWDDNGCDGKGGPPLPQLAREYATQTPQVGPGQPVTPSPNPVTPSTPITPPTPSSGNLATGAAAGGGVVLALIVISRIIRLFPPLLPLELSPI